MSGVVDGAANGVRVEHQLKIAIITSYQKILLCAEGVATLQRLLNSHQF